MQSTPKNLAEFDTHPLWGEFRTIKTEKDFLRYQLSRSQSQLRTALVFCSFFYVAFALTDVAALGYTPESLTLFLARMLVAVSAAAGIYLIYRRPLSVTVPLLTATVVEIVGMGSFMLIVFYRAHEMPWHAMAMSIMLIVIYLFIPNRLICSLGVALLSTVIFISLALQVGNLKSSDLLSLSMLLILANTFGVVAARRYHRLWRDEFRAQSLLKRLTVRDHLTGCLNRRHLDDDMLGKEIVRAQRHSLWLTVVLCDLDHFKAVNDTYGHQAGDAVICAFSQLLQQGTREHVDYVIRYGGEEFLLILPGTDLAGGELLAERLRIAFSENPIFHAADKKIRMTASFGVAAINFSDEGKTISQYELITAADKLLYKAKEAGRNLVESVEL